MTDLQAILQECDSCAGTGLYSGFAEGDGVACVCKRCNGSGQYTHTFRPFVKRKTKRGIKTIMSESWGRGEMMTYAEFKRTYPEDGE